MFFRLKSEIFWVLKEKGIEIFYGNSNLNKMIYIENKQEFIFLLEKILNIRGLK